MHRFMSKSKRKHDVKRIVVCVDGTWYNADGKERRRGSGNVSNTFRIYASVKQGTFEQDGKVIKQVAKYFHGIGVKTTTYDRYNDGITGEGCKQLIRDVYQHCCAEVTSPNDELWLFGFSRGAYVVRAVSALFRELATLNKQNTGQFQNDYRDAIEYLNAKHRREIKNQTGELYNFFLQKLREGPVIQFLGLFDTVMKTQGDVDLDLSFSKSTRHVRHALALNEERSIMTPEIYETKPRALNTTWEPESIIQAWFVGMHSDMGGGGKDDGLALYPLQWMLVESQKHHLVLEFNPPKWITDKISVEHPPRLVLPGVVDETGSNQSYRNSRDRPDQQEEDDDDDNSIMSSESQGQDEYFSEWRFETQNGIKLTMYDIRVTHKHGNLQDLQRKRLQKKRPEDISTHQVVLQAPSSGGILGRKPRPVFETAGLVGYNKSHAYGTIIHPSVFFLQDTYPNLGIGEALEKFGPALDKCREGLQPVSGSKIFPWLLQRKISPSLQQIRILICGRSGVGKSTLLNRVFGVDLTTVNTESRGVHDIDQGFESDQYPGVIIHDSEGFEAGDTKRVQAFESFVKKRGSSSRAKQQLHAVWICNDMSTSRAVETAFERILTFIEGHAPGLPVIFVGTKKDRYLKADADLSAEEVRALEAGQATAEQVMEDARRDNERKASWKRQLDRACPTATANLAIEWAFVSRDNRESIKQLMHATLKPLNSNSARLGLVAAQVVDRDPKLVSAVDQTMSFLRTAVTASSAGAMAVLINRISAPTVSRLLCDAIVRCYGLAKPPVAGIQREAEVDYIMTTVVWRNLGAFMSRSFFAGIGDISTLFIGAPLIEAPVMARMVIKCACDLIIILDRAFQIGGKHAAGVHITQASKEYMQPAGDTVYGTSSRHLSRKQLVHRRVNKLIPAISALAVKIYQRTQIDAIRQGIVGIIEQHRMDALPLTGADVAIAVPTAVGDDKSITESLLGEKVLDSSSDAEDLDELSRTGRSTDESFPDVVKKLKAMGVAYQPTDKSAVL